MLHHDVAAFGADKPNSPIGVVAEPVRFAPIAFGGGEVMPKSRAHRRGALVAAGVAATVGWIAPVPAASCEGHGPAMLVEVEGLKTRTGTIRVQSYGGDPRHYFDKGSYLQRLEVATPPAGPVELCLPVPRPGLYAVSVRHDVNGNRKSELADGGGMSGNPEVSLMDVILKRRPSPEQVQVEVKGVVAVRIVMNYVHGASVGPITGFKR
jgi:uncharacterized protein (DUF2141 family)